MPHDSLFPGLDFARMGREERSVLAWERKLVMMNIGEKEKPTIPKAWLVLS